MESDESSRVTTEAKHLLSGWATHLQEISERHTFRDWQMSRSQLLVLTVVSCGRAMLNIGRI